MKRFSSIVFYVLISLVITSYGQNINLHQYFDDLENLEVSLITAAPSDLVYGTWGHSALRLRSLNGTTRQDLVINYGMFDYQTEHFVSKFIRGILPYSLGIEPYNSFVVSYLERDQRLTEQVINLSIAKKNTLLNLININLLPDNRIYRYDHFKDNCATRIRDLIETCYADSLIYPWGQSNKVKYSDESFVDLIEPFVKRKPWLQFGTDIILGYSASQQATFRDRMFLPDNMMKAYENTHIVSNQKIKLIKETRILNSGTPLEEPSGLLGPMTACSLLLLIMLSLFIVEYRCGKWFWKVDILWLLFTGLVGCLLLFMWIGTTHWSTYANLNLLWANPLALVGIFLVRSSFARYIASALLWSAILVITVGLVGWQHMAPMVYLIAIINGLRGYRILRFSN